MSDKETLDQESNQPEINESTTISSTPLAEKFTLSNSIITVLILVIIALLIMPGTDQNSETVTEAVSENTPEETASVEMPALVQATPEPAAQPTAMAASSMSMAESSGGIERKNEGRLFYRTIKIPANAETLYLSGSGASAKPDGTWGNMEEQAINTFTKFKQTLEEEGWSMRDIVQVRAFAVAGEYGLLDFDGFNRGYSRFFGTEENPNKPVRSFVQVADLVNPNWLVEVEVRAARVP